ncbi:MAG: ferritin family protein [Bacteroidales bacterium]|nr:ferritin family protein [Bacteroidales bacterium]
MNNFQTVDEILDFAIENEQNAADFYFKLAETTKDRSIRETFKIYAHEEIGHKEKLIQVKKEGVFKLEKQTILDLKVADYVVRQKVSESMTYQDALILAMKREKAAYRLYMKLASNTDLAQFKDLFIGLAQEEAKHKMAFEIEYDDVILKEN